MDRKFNKNLKHITREKQEICVPFIFKSTCIDDLLCEPRDVSLPDLKRPARLKPAEL